MGRYDPSRSRVTTLTAPLGADGKLSQGFPLGMSVDELRWYSRRRPTDVQKGGNICLEAGSLKDALSEYKCSFKSPLFVARSLGNLADHAENEKENLNLRRFSSQSEDLVGKATHINTRFRPKDYLRPEGDMTFETEKTDQFIEYVLSKRPDLLRRDTELKLEGDIETLTENKDKFITFDNYCTRPPLAKHDTNLHLEGDFLHLPEYKEVFVDFPRHRPSPIKPNPWLHVNTDDKMDTFSETLERFIQHNLKGLKPELLKRPTNLKCEGAFQIRPEYHDAFKEFPIEKRTTIKQLPSLRLEGEFHSMPEYKDKYVPLPLVKNEPSKNPDSLNLDENLIVPVQNNDIAYIPSNANAQNVSKTEENLPVSTDNRETSPKSTYPKKIEAVDNQGNAPKQIIGDHKKRLTDISHKGIPLSSNLETTVTARPPKGRRSRTSSLNSNSSLSRRQELALLRQQPRSENRNSVENKLVDSPKTPYQRKLKSPDMSSGSNKFESQPEYRKAYVDYLIRERLPARSPDRVLEKPPLNLKWLKRGDSSNPSFDIVRQNKNYADDYPSEYRPSSRRGSITSIAGSVRRSESPTYKLQVTNVDEPKRGFGSRSYKKGLSEYNINNSSHSPSRQMRINEPLQSNVVLRERSRRHWQRNTDYNYDDTRNNAFVVLDRSRLPQQVSKWNSPWYKHPDD